MYSYTDSFNELPYSIQFTLNSTPPHLYLRYLHRYYEPVFVL
jgi:hypothetical protein